MMFYPGEVIGNPVPCRIKACQADGPGGKIPCRIKDFEGIKT